MLIAENIDVPLLSRLSCSSTRCVDIEVILARATDSQSVASTLDALL